MTDGNGVRPGADERPPQLLFCRVCLAMRAMIDHYDERAHVLELRCVVCSCLAGTVQYVHREQPPTD